MAFIDDEDIIRNEHSNYDVAYGYMFDKTKFKALDGTEYYSFSVLFKHYDFVVQKVLDAGWKLLSASHTKVNEYNRMNDEMFVTVVKEKKVEVKTEII